MAKNKDRINQRLAAITTAKPVELPDTIPKAKRPRRQEDRQSVYRFARIVLSDKSQIRCVLKDISPGGARVILEGNIALPPTFTIKIDQSGITRKARLAWQDETQVGVCFRKAPETTGG